MQCSLLGETRTSQVKTAVQAQTTENLADEWLHFNFLSLKAEPVVDTDDSTGCASRSTIAGQVLGPSHSFESSLQAAGQERSRLPGCPVQWCGGQDTQIMC